MERHGNDGTFRKILDGYAESQGQSPTGGYFCSVGQKTSIHHADSHALRNVVKGNGKNHHGGFCQMAFRPLRLTGISVQMRNDMVQQQKEENTEPETDECRKKRQRAEIFRLVHRGDQEAPDGGSYHDAGGKTRQCPLNRNTEILFHKKDTGGTGCRAEKGNQQAENCILHNSYLLSENKKQWYNTGS